MIDFYCERAGSGLWAEPLNAATNVAFFVGAWAAWLMARRLHALSPGTVVLVAFIVTVGIGSSLFHTFATTWARILDIGPILLFEISYLWLYGRRVAALSAGTMAALLIAFLAAAYAGLQFPHVLNRSLVYAPAVVAVIVLGVYHHRARKAANASMLAACAIFLIAVGFRTIDNAVCAAFPLGTHFLWHLLIPVALFLFMRSLLVNSEDVVRRRAPFPSNDDFFQAVSALIARLEERGHRRAAAELREAFGCLNGLTDGAVLFLESVEKVQRSESARLAPEDGDALERIRIAAQRAAYGRG
jgi:hypothetical protein